jgi:hypothetical protein
MRDVIKQIEAIFEKEGYTDISLQSSAHSHTLSAQKGEIQAVVHLTNQQELPLASSPNQDVPRPSNIRVKAIVPGAVPAKQSQVSLQGRVGTVQTPAIMGDSGTSGQGTVQRPSRTRQA